MPQTGIHYNRDVIKIERMKNMALWTWGHVITVLPTLAVSILLAAALRAWIGKRSLWVRMIPVQIIAVLLLLLEAGKQILSFRRGYALFHIPLHFCSLFIFALPIMAFYRGRHQQYVRTVVSSLCMAVAALMLIFPNIIYAQDNVTHLLEDFMNFHTVIFHNLVLCAFVLILGLQLYAPQNPGEQKAVILCVAGFCVVSAGAAHLLQVNFANFYTCNVGPLENVRLAIRDVLGAVPTQILYVSIIAGLHICFVWGCYGLLCLVRKRMGLHLSQA